MAAVGTGTGTRRGFGDEEDDLEAWRQIMQDPQHDNDDNESDESDESAEDNPDHIIPARGEKLPLNDIYTYEGYGIVW